MILVEMVVFAPYDEVGDRKQWRLPLALIIYFQNLILDITIIIKFIKLCVKLLVVKTFRILTAERV